MAPATLLAPPNVPRSSIPPPAVQRKACWCPSAFRLEPTTWVASLMPKAMLSVPPRVPRLRMPRPGRHRKARSRPLRFGAVCRPSSPAPSMSSPALVARPGFPGRACLRPWSRGRAGQSARVISTSPVTSLRSLTPRARLSSAQRPEVWFALSCTPEKRLLLPRERWRSRRPPLAVEPDGAALCRREGAEGSGR